MAVIKPFKGLRPTPRLAAQVAAPPYDVVNREEAKQLAAGNPYSFLRINKPEIDLDDAIDAYDPRVYQHGAENLQRYREEGILQQDSSAHFYVYKQVMGEHQQIGLVAAASVAEYEQDLIKKHEFTRPDKEDDRVNHILGLNAQVGPVFLTYRAKASINAVINSVVNNTPIYDFVSSDGVRHVLWPVGDANLIDKLQTEFRAIPCLYVADGHHRSAAAMRVKQHKQQHNAGHTGEESYNYFLTVIFPHDQMKILDYNRVIKDLHGLSEQEFLQRLQTHFTVTESTNREAAKPKGDHQFGMYFQKQWYLLQAKQGIWNGSDPVQKLDVSILQNNLLAPILGIENPRTDKRIDFVGGIRGLAELEKRVDSGEWAVAFALYPTSIENLMTIADAGKVMPPKSTWFEPKLKSGLVVHLLD